MTTERQLALYRVCESPHVLAGRRWVAAWEPSGEIAGEVVFRGRVGQSRDAVARSALDVLGLPVATRIVVYRGLYTEIELAGMLAAL